MIYAFEEYSLDADRRELRRGAALIAAEPQTFDLLLYLVQNRERVVSKDDLMAAVWSGRIVSESTLSSQITAVRHAIGDDGERQILVRTFARKGFRFVGDVQENGERQRLSIGEAANDPQRTDRTGWTHNQLERPARRQLSVMICSLAGVGAHSATRQPCPRHAGHGCSRPLHPPCRSMTLSHRRSFWTKRRRRFRGGPSPVLSSSC